MSKFIGCLKWSYNGQSSCRTNLPHVNFAECEPFYTLVHPLWAASFWQNADESLKHGVRLAHQKSHKGAIPSGLLRWSYGLAPDVNPPAKVDWRRGASRRRRRSNRGSSAEFLLSVGDAGADGGDGHADGSHDDYDAGGDDDDADGDSDDGGIDNAADNDDSGHLVERDRDHDGRHDDRGGGVQHHDDDGEVGGHQAFDSNANDGHDDDFEHGDANSGDDQHAHDQYDDRNGDRHDY